MLIVDRYIFIGCCRYDMRDSPPVALPIPVKIGITLLSLQSPDESSLVSTS